VEAPIAAGQRHVQHFGTLQAATGTIGVIVVAVSGLTAATGIYAASRRAVVNALNVIDVAPPTSATIAA
jgi:hypothetical protein